MSKEYKIGDTLEYEGVPLEVIEDLRLDCCECYFYQIGKCNALNKNMSKIIGACEASERKDKNYILYVKDESVEIKQHGNT